MSEVLRTDVVVVGLGAMGSAALHHLSRSGVRVIGLDRHAPPHTLGSTHGRSRITREAIYEHPLYVPIVRRANELWTELEAEADSVLFHRTGALMIGPPGGELVAGARRSAELHAIPYEILDASEVRTRFPAFAPPEEAVALLEHNAGLLLPENIIEAQLRLAEQRGATVITSDAATGCVAEGDGVVVTTESGTRVEAECAIVAAGAWLPRFFPELELPLQIERQLLHWFRPVQREEVHRADCCPLSLWEFAPDRLFATFSDLADGVKCGVHHEGEILRDPESINRTISPEEDATVRALLAAIQPLAAGDQVESRVCIYTNTPDHHFLIDRHPLHPQILFASPCSGHGFKFSSAIGELLSDTARGAQPRVDCSAFSLARFSA